MFALQSLYNMATNYNLHNHNKLETTYKGIAILRKSITSNILNLVKADCTKELDWLTVYVVKVLLLHDLNAPLDS